MNVRIIIHALLLCSFSFAHAMESGINNDAPITDENLQQLILHINKSSLNIVNLVKKHADENYMQLTSHTIKPLLNIDQNMINKLFLDNVENDTLRPLLFAMGADINTKTEKNRNCLWSTKKPELLAQFIQQGAEVNAIAKDGATCLHDLLYFLDYPDAYENIIAAEALLKGGANPNILKNGCCLFYRTIKCSKADIRLKATQLLCEYNANHNIKNPLTEETPLISAIKTGDLKLVELLLINKADPNLSIKDPNTPNKDDRYPLHIAMGEERFEYGPFSIKKAIIPAIAILLLKHGANPNKPYNDTGNMPLHVAVLLGRGEIIKALIEYGAEKHHRNYDDLTAFDLAQPESRYEQLTKEIVDLLIPDPNMIMTFSTTDYEVPTEKNLNNNTSNNNTRNQNGYCSQQ